MAEILTWRDEWTLHIDTLDDDHRRIVSLFLEIARRFNAETERPEGSKEGVGADDTDDDLYASLDRFGTFTRSHFRREEELVRTIDYPGLPHHRSEHTLLMAEFTALVRELRERGVERLDPQDLETLKQWILAHIVGADRRFADHYFQICDSATDQH